MTVFNFNHIPFSRHQQYTTISMMSDPYDPKRQACYLRSVKGGDEKPLLGRLCEILILDTAGKILECQYKMTPTKLTVTGLKNTTPIGQVMFSIGDRENVYFSIKNCQLRLVLLQSRYSYIYMDKNGIPCMVVAGQNSKISPYLKSGKISVLADWQDDNSQNASITIFPDGTDTAQGVLDIFETVSQYRNHTDISASIDFDKNVSHLKQVFATWHQSIHGDTVACHKTDILASYILWANFVPPKGNLKRPALYMSKNHMINIWSWDNVFSAIGLVQAYPKLALDQLQVIYDHQDSTGLLPDFINDEAVSFSFTKPPIHGWAVDMIMRTYPDCFDNSMLNTLYTHLKKQVEYWLNYTSADTKYLPYYTHGNDSGWDNASFFAMGGPVESPDLPTFLILCLECLATLSKKLGYSYETQQFVDKSTQLFTLLMDNLYNGSTFICRKWDSDKNAWYDVPNSSLIQFMPLLLGNRLQKSIADKLVSLLQSGGYITQWGLATESIHSSYYRSNGYWRGPIWAPTTFLIWDGLCRQNQCTLAQQIAEKFITLAQVNGLAENYDAIHGNGLCDRAFTWTSATYIHFSKYIHQIKTN